jgi:hypothetical protein
VQELLGLTGLDVGRLLPFPDISNKQFPEMKIHEDKGLHRILYRFIARRTAPGRAKCGIDRIPKTAKSLYSKMGRRRSRLCRI